MFIFLLLDVYTTSLTRLSAAVGARAAADYGVQRVREKTARTTVEAVDVAEVPGLLEVAFDQLRVAPVIEAVPDLHRLRWKTAMENFSNRQTSAARLPLDAVRQQQEPEGAACSGVALTRKPRERSYA